MKLRTPCVAWETVVRIAVALKGGFRPTIGLLVARSAEDLISRPFGWRISFDRQGLVTMICERGSRRITGLSIHVWVVCLLCSIAVPSAAGPLASGTIDLTTMSFDETSLIPLEGEWLIYWKRLLHPDDLRGSSAPKPDGTFAMPSTWNEWKRNGEPVGGIGYATFTVRVLLPDGMDAGSLRIPNASTAYRLWGNGKELASSGIPGTAGTKTTPRYRMLTAEYSAPEGELFLVLQVANFHHRRGGMWRPIELGTRSAVEAAHILETFYDLLLIGSFLAMSLYNLSLYYTGRGIKKGPVYLGLLFAVLVLRIPMMGQMVVTQVFPQFPWSLQLRVEYLTAQLALLFLTWTLSEIYPHAIPRRFARLVTLVVALNAMLVVLGSVLLYSRIVRWYVYTMIAILFIETVLLIIAFVRGDRTAWYGIGAAAVTFFITVGETIHYQEIILSRDFAPFGFVITLVTGQSVNQTTAYMISAAINLGLLFLVSNLIALRGSQALFVVAGSPHDSVPPQSPEPETEAVPSASGSPLSDDLKRFRLKELYGITPREAEIIRFVSEGKSNRALAAQLFVSEGTVKTHMYHILRKTGLSNRTELGRLYLTLLHDGVNGSELDASRRKDE